MLNLPRSKFLVFNQLPYIESPIEKSNLKNGKNQKSNDFSVEKVFSDSEEIISEDDGLITSEDLSENCLSTILANIQLPNNPLSEIGDPSEEKLLKITNSPFIGALTEVRVI